MPLDALRARLRTIEAATALLAEFEQLDVDRAVAEIVAQLDASFRMYRERLTRHPRPITAIQFYWAGAEIEPWVPSVVMGNVYAGNALLLDSTGGFDPIPATLFYDSLQGSIGQDDEEGDDDDDTFSELKQLFVAASVELARRAVAIALRGAPFAALTIERPFEILAIPGHDTDALLLIRIE